MAKPMVSKNLALSKDEEEHIEVLRQLNEKDRGFIFRHAITTLDGEQRCQQLMAQGLTRDEANKQYSAELGQRFDEALAAL